MAYKYKDPHAIFSMDMATRDDALGITNEGVFDDSINRLTYASLELVAEQPNARYYIHDTVDSLGYGYKQY